MTTAKTAFPKANGSGFSTAGLSVSELENYP